MTDGTLTDLAAAIRDGFRSTDTQTDMYNRWKANPSVVSRLMGKLHRRSSG